MAESSCVICSFLCRFGRGTCFSCERGEFRAKRYSTWVPAKGVILSPLSKAKSVLQHLLSCHFLHNCTTIIVKPPLVLVLGLRDSEFETLISLLQTWGTPNDMLPTIITNEAGQGKDRFEMYQRGGVFCITSRILIVDLLTNVICSEDIDGLLVGHADQVTNDSTAAFIIRIYTSQKRRDRCFIKAFTDYPDALLTGFAKVDKVLKALQVRQLYLYPRFHDVIKNELEQNPPEVEELHQPLSPAMKEIQSAIVAAIQTCMRELKASTPFIEWTGAEFSIENCVTQSFDRAVFHQLRKDWFKLKPQTKQLHQGSFCDI